MIQELSLSTVAATPTVTRRTVTRLDTPLNPTITGFAYGHPS